MAYKLVIISGAQSGVERAALDWTVKHDLPRAGWHAAGLPEAPDPQHKLREAGTENILEVIDANIRDADATVVFTTAAKAAGTAQKAVSLSKKHKKPVLHVHRGILGISEKIVAFLDKYYVRRLHLTGTADAEEAGLAAWVAGELEKTKSILDRRPD